jgi:hypothetical protein
MIGPITYDMTFDPFYVAKTPLGTPSTELAAGVIVAIIVGVISVFLVILVIVTVIVYCRARMASKKSKQDAIKQAKQVSDV